MIGTARSGLHGSGFLRPEVHSADGRCHISPLSFSKGRIERRGAVSLERAKKHLAEYGRDGDVLEFETSSATVELAAQAVGCEPERIAKTLSFAVGDRVALVVCAGDARIANPKFKARFGCKAKMLPADEAEERIGHAVGGVCPFGVKDGCDVYLDESLRRFDMVYPACGSSNSAIALAPDELAAIVPKSEWVDVCKLPE